MTIQDKTDLPQVEYDENAQVDPAAGDRFSFVVGPDRAGERLDKVISDSIPGQSRSYIKKLIKDGYISLKDPLNKQKAVKPSLIVCGGETVSVFLPVQVLPDILPEDIPLDILYEDNDVLVVNKPKDMVVHPAAGHYSGTLVNAVLFHCKGSLSGINGVLRPGIVHRIDKDTTGSIIVCKNDAAHRCIAEQLKEHSITRRYRGIVIGNVPRDDGTIEGNIGRNPYDRKKMSIVREGGKPAVTHYHVLKRYSGYTYCEFSLETGRTHQIRVHMASIGHPLVGDSVYGPARSAFHIEGQALHAMVIGFVHPATGEYLSFTAPLPEYFTELLQKLEHRQ